MSPPVHDARSRAAGHAALVFVQLCFGLMPIFGTWAFRPGGFQPLAVAAWRIGVGALVLMLLASLVDRRSLRLPARDLRRAFGLAWLGIVLNQGFYLEGLARSSAMQAGLLTCLIPVFTFLVAALTRQERFSWPRALGVAVALLGAAPLFLQRGARLELSLGVVFLACSSLVYSCYLVLSKPLLARHSPLAVLAWVYCASVPGALFFAWRAPLLPSAPRTSAPWIALGLILAFPTLLAYLLNLFALARVRASTTAVYIYAQPLIASAASYLLLGQRPTPGMLRAGAALFLGIWLVARPPARSAPGTIAIAPKA